MLRRVPGRASTVLLLVLLAALLAAATTLVFWLLWEDYRAPRRLLVDAGALALLAIVVAALARPAPGGTAGWGTRAMEQPTAARPVRASYLSLSLWALGGGFLAAAAFSSLAMAPWLLLAASALATAGLLAAQGAPWRRLRAVAVVLAAALLNGLVLWLCLLSPYRPAPQDAFRGRDFYANQILADVPVHDMWIVALEGGGEGRTVQDVQAVMASASAWEANSLVAVLAAVRGLLGWVFGWDDERFDEPELSYLDRVSDEVRARSLQEPGIKSGYFRLLYTLENETVAEILNRTAHAFFCMALEPVEGGYALYWVIFVKEEKPLTPFYLGLIDPFRRYLVHPAILRSLERRWHAVQAGSVGGGNSVEPARRSWASRSEFRFGFTETLPTGRRRERCRDRMRGCEDRLGARASATGAPLEARRANR